MIDMKDDHLVFWSSCALLSVQWTGSNAGEAADFNDMIVQYIIFTATLYAPERKLIDGISYRRSVIFYDEI